MLRLPIVKLTTLAALAAAILTLGQATTAEANLVAGWSSGQNNTYLYDDVGTESRFGTTTDGSTYGSILGTITFSAEAIAASGGALVAGPIDAVITLYATTLGLINVAAPGANGQLVEQGGWVGQMSFIGATGSGFDGQNLLTIDFADANLDARIGGTTATLGGSSALGQTVDMTSDFLTLSPPTDFRLSVANVNPSIALVAFNATQSVFRDFLGGNGGEGSALISAIPEPSTVITALAGLPVLGLALRRRARRAVEQA